MSAQDAIRDEFVGLVAASIDDGQVLTGIDRLLVACSGGGDSVALLAVLLRLAGPRSLHLTVAHLDHGWRPDSGADADLVVELARTAGVPVVVRRLGTDGGGGSLEARFRDARLRFFRDAAAEAGCQAVATGHTLEDQAETVLMNLARGSARAGLAGMAHRTEIDGLVVVRPLLHLSRAQARCFAAACGLAWREDPSNRDPRFTRNRVRAEVLPALEEAIPGAVRNIARGAELLRDEEAWLDRIVEVHLGALAVERSPRMLVVDLSALTDLEPGLARRVVRAAIQRIRGDLRGIERSHVEAVLGPVARGDEAARDLPGVRVRRTGGDLVFEPLPAPDDAPRAPRAS